MYALKPVISLPEKVALPNVMYELPRIQGSGGCGSTAGKTEPDQGVVAEQMQLSEYNLLEARQVRILKQIYELKQQVEGLCIAVRVSSDVKDPAEVLKKLNLNIEINETPVHAEIIVLAHPNSPPYFILALQRLWKDTRFNVEVHRHSTVSDATTTAFEEKLLSSAPKDAVHSIDIKLIWKDVSDVQLITKVHDYPLEGEANILRYLMRLIENYNYETKSAYAVCTIDTLLDLCLRLSYEEARNVNAITSKLAYNLDKKTWLLDSSNASIVDVAAWSVLKRVLNNRVPRELKNWYDLCEKTFLAI